MIYGYIRISTEKQHIKNQIFEIEKFAKKNDLHIDRWIKETISSTAVLKKRKLNTLLRRLGPDDIVIATEISRLGRNMLQLMSILNDCVKSGAQVWTLKDNYRLGSTIESKILAFAFGLSAEIERNLISERTREALERIKKSGRRLGREVGSKNKNPLLKRRKKDIIEMLNKGVKKTQIARILKVQRQTVYRYIKQLTESGDYVPPANEPQNKKTDDHLSVQNT